MTTSTPQKLQNKPAPDAQQTAQSGLSLRDGEWVKTVSRSQMGGKVTPEMLKHALELPQAERPEVPESLRKVQGTFGLKVGSGPRWDD